MQQWFVVPEEGRDWADKAHRERYLFVLNFLNFIFLIDRKSVV